MKSEVKGKVNFIEIECEKFTSRVYINLLLSALASVNLKEKEPFSQSFVNLGAPQTEKISDRVTPSKYSPSRSSVKVSLVKSLPFSHVSSVQSRRVSLVKSVRLVTSRSLVESRKLSNLVS